MPMHLELLVSNDERVLSAIRAFACEALRQTRVLALVSKLKSIVVVRCNHREFELNRTAGGVSRRRT